MRNQLQRHFVAAFRTKQRVLTKAFEETLSKRFCRHHSVPPWIIGHICRYNIGELFSHFFITYVSVKTVISNSLKTFWQYVLNHSSDELESREGFMFNLLCFVVPIPVADRFAIITFNPSYRDWRRDDILRQILSQSLAARWHLSWLKESDKTFGIIFPCPVDVFFDGRVIDIIPQHVKQMILPFPVHHLIRNIRDTFPLFGRINSTGGHENMKMRVIMAGPSSGLENNNVSNIEFNAGAGVENIFKAGMSCSHERAEQFRITIKPGPEELRHGQYDMSICHAGQESPSNEVCPSVGMALGTGKTKAGLAGESNATCLSAFAASVLDKAHFLRVTATEHFLDSVVVIRTVKAWADLLKRIPVIIENLLKCVFVNAFHGCSLRTTITESAK